MIELGYKKKKERRARAHAEKEAKLVEMDKAEARLQVDKKYVLSKFCSKFIQIFNNFFLSKILILN